MPLDQETLSGLISAAAEKNNLVKVAADHVVARTEAMRQDQLAIKEKLKQANDNYVLDDYSGIKLLEHVLCSLEREIEIISEFDKTQKLTEATLPPQVTNHKMGFILNALRDQLLQTQDAESLITRVAEGKCIPEFKLVESHRSSDNRDCDSGPSKSPRIDMFVANQGEFPDSFHDAIPLLKTDTYWGSNSGVLGTALLLATRFAFSTDSIQDYKFTSVAHIATCTGINDFDFGKSKFITSNKDSLNFGFVHGGYAFGGSCYGSDSSYKFVPEDCSTIVSKWINEAKPKVAANSVNISSTAQMLYHWREKHQKNRDKFSIDPQIYTPEIKQECSRIFGANIANTVLEPGDVYLSQTFNVSSATTIDRSNPVGGHTGVVLDFNPTDRKVMIFECARNMERENKTLGLYGSAGAGVSEYNTNYDNRMSDRTVRTMFLRPVL